MVLVSGSIIVAGVLSKCGAYELPRVFLVLIKFGFLLVPFGFCFRFGWWSVFSLFYLQQKGLKSPIACFSMSHVSMAIGGTII